MSKAGPAFRNQQSSESKDRAPIVICHLLLKPESPCWVLFPKAGCFSDICFNSSGQRQIIVGMISPPQKKMA